jgi:uncharacterized protein involved in outer membrane biogenesis
MNKKIKLIFIILGGFILLGSIGAWYVTSNLNPAQLAQLLSSSVKSATGRELKIAGPITLSLFPKIAVSAKQLSLSNAAWASAPDMLTLKQIELDVKFLPLLSKNIEIGSIKLSGLELFLQKNSSGKANWDMSAQIPNSVAISSGATPTNSSSDSLISMENIAVTDAQIHYQDSLGLTSDYQVKRLSMVKSGDATEVTLDMKYGDLALGVVGKTGAISKALKEWDVSPIKFPLDLTLSMSGKSLLLKGEIDKQPKAIPTINLAVTSKEFDWPSRDKALAQTSLVSGKSQVQVTSQPTKSQAQYLFSNENLSLDLLSSAKGIITLDIHELDLAKRKPIQNLRASIQMKGDSIDIPNLTFQIDNGSADIQLNISQLSSSAPALSLKGITKNFTLENLLSRIDPSSKVSGGNMKFAFDIKTSGKSLHQMAANSNGKIQMTIQQAEMGSNFLNDAGDFVITLLDSMNPLRKKSKETILECAVAYLPINNGQINIANTVGTETDRLNVVLAGSINLKTERVDLTIDPREKSGLTTGIDLAGLVKIGGTLTQPKAGINQSGVVNSAVSIGLGILTGGATILAENAKSMATKGHPCRDALHPWSDIYPGAE